MASASRYYGPMSHVALEIFFISLLVVAGLSMAWFAGLVVWQTRKSR